MRVNWLEVYIVRRCSEHLNYGAGAITSHIKEGRIKEGRLLDSCEPFFFSRNKRVVAHAPLERRLWEMNFRKFSTSQGASLSDFGMFIAQGQPSISAMVPLSITVGVITTSFGIWFSRQKHRPYRGSVLGTLTAGILVGIALLSMLPEAIDQLTECGWHTSTVIFMCIGAGGFIFFLENVVLPHEHITSGGEGPLATGDSAATASPPATASTSTVEVELACVPCEPCEDGAEALPPTLPPKKAAIVWGPPRGGKQAPKPPGTKGGAKGSVGDGLRNGCRKPRPQPMWAKRGSAAFLELDREAMCECCDEAGGARVNDGSEAVAEESVTAPPPSTWRTLMATSLRQLAWLLHATIDGMVLAAARKETGRSRLAAKDA